MKKNSGSEIIASRIIMTYNEIRNIILIMYAFANDLNVWNNLIYDIHECMCVISHRFIDTWYSKAIWYDDNCIRYRSSGKPGLYQFLRSNINHDRYQFNNLLKFILYLFIIYYSHSLFLYQNICAKMYLSFGESRHVWNYQIINYITN